MITLWLKVLLSAICPGVLYRRSPRREKHATGGGSSLLVNSIPSKRTTRGGLTPPCTLRALPCPLYLRTGERR